jgi:glycosyltransferase EpsH
MVSIIIPVYNGERYIEKCLGSLLSENREGIEVIAINDGSRDSSLSLLQSFAEKYPNLKVIDKENGGAAQARLRGLKEATGDFIGFLDVDDWVNPKMYVEMEQKAMASGSDLVFCNYVEEMPSQSRVVKNQLKK